MADYEGRGSERITSHHEELTAHIEMADRTVVDVGCGAGGLSRWMRSRGARVVSFDPSETALAKARSDDPEFSDAYQLGTGESLPLTDSSVDLVVYSYSLHHVPVDLMDRAISEARRVLRSGGRLVSIEPLASGAGYQVNRLIFDEAEVRAAAQSALDRASGAGFVEHNRLRYYTEYVYTSFEDWCEQIVSNDPERAEVLAQSTDRLRGEFTRLASTRDNKFVFLQPNIMRVLSGTGPEPSTRE